jgi:hypothetical protein
MTMMMTRRKMMMMEKKKQWIRVMSIKGNVIKSYYPQFV